jgi:SAM-dependent methyltransferase
MALTRDEWATAKPGAFHLVARQNLQMDRLRRAQSGFTHLKCPILLTVSFASFLIPLMLLKFLAGFVVLPTLASIVPLSAASYQEFIRFRFCLSETLNPKRNRLKETIMSTAASPPLNMDKLNAFIGQFVTDLGAAVHTGMVVIGEKLGLYKSLAEEPVSCAQLAAKTGTDERYLREWLASQAAGGYITYDENADQFSMTPEQAFTLANDQSPAYLPGAFELALGSLAAVPRIAESFRSGAGMGWHEHVDGVFHGCEKFFRPGYAANLVSSWIPALEGVKEKLEAGALVADVGCGKGASTILMAQAFPNARFHGFDYHDKSIEAARESADRAGVADRVTFEVSNAKSFPGSDYDFVAVFDCLHDMGDPVGAAAHVRKALATDGTWMIVEPFAHDLLKDNLNPVGRVYYAFSTLLCTPCSRSQEVGLCLGAQAGEGRIRDVVSSAGFTRFRRATETPFNIVYEARP